MVKAVLWEEDSLKLIDQTLLPTREVWLTLQSAEAAFEAIKSLRVRGAPAIGITAAYGLYLGMRNSKVEDVARFFEVLDQQVDFLASARPTAVNLSWALREIRSKLRTLPNPTVPQLLAVLLEEAVALHEDDRRRCEAMADHGQSLIPQNARILTVCNTGALATGGIGTAFGVIYRAHTLGKQIEVFPTETRPVLQGARLTVYELTRAGIPTTLICDNMAAALMQKKGVDLVIAGADRITADGSVANKIGTYSLAVLARHHGIPFYVAAPFSTIDAGLPGGSDIPIENRPADEIRRVFNQTLITLPDVPCWNPAFDVTPPELVDGIITERGVLRPPYREQISHFITENNPIKSEELR